MRLKVCYKRIISYPFVNLLIKDLQGKSSCGFFVSFYYLQTTFFKVALLKTLAVLAFSWCFLDVSEKHLRNKFCNWFLIFQRRMRWLYEIKRGVYCSLLIVLKVQNVLPDPWALNSLFVNPKHSLWLWLHVYTHAPTQTLINHMKQPNSCRRSSTQQETHFPSATLSHPHTQPENPPEG